MATTDTIRFQQDEVDAKLRNIDRDLANATQVFRDIKTKVDAFQTDYATYRTTVNNYNSASTTEADAKEILGQQESKVGTIKAKLDGTVIYLNETAGF